MRLVRDLCALGSPKSGAPKAAKHDRATFPGSAPCSERSLLGCHSTTSRLRLRRRLSLAAAPAVAGMAVAVCMSPQAHAATSAVHAATPRTAAADATSEAGLSPAELLSCYAPGRQARGRCREVSYVHRPVGRLAVRDRGRVYHQPGRVAGALLGQPPPDPLGQRHRGRPGPAGPGQARKSPARPLSSGGCSCSGAGSRIREPGAGHRDGSHFRLLERQLLGRHARRLVVAAW